LIPEELSRSVPSLLLESKRKKQREQKQFVPNEKVRPPKLKIDHFDFLPALGRLDKINYHTWATEVQS
jgi:hypothetical protein